MKKTIKNENHAKENAKCALESIREMVSALRDSGYDEEKREEALTRIQKDPLSVEVRSDWYVPGQGESRAAEYKILLTWGGPACQIVGYIDDHGHPETARIEYQDWGTPWTEYLITAEEEKDVIFYAEQFYYEA